MTLLPHEAAQRAWLRNDTAWLEAYEAGQQSFEDETSDLEDELDLLKAELRDMRDVLAELERLAEVAGHQTLRNLLHGIAQGCIGSVGDVERFVVDHPNTFERTTP